MVKTESAVDELRAQPLEDLPDINDGDNELMCLIRTHIVGIETSASSSYALLSTTGKQVFAHADCRLTKDRIKALGRRVNVAVAGAYAEFDGKWHHWAQATILISTISQKAAIAVENHGRLVADDDPCLFKVGKLDAIPDLCAYFELPNLRTPLGYKFSVSAHKLSRMWW